MIFVCLFLTTNFNFVDPENVNVLYLNEVRNEVSDKAINSVLSYIKDTPHLNITITKLTKVTIDNEPKVALESLCSGYMEMLNSGNPPDVVFDASKAGIVSEILKSFVRLLGLPTVAGSLGQRGDIRQWRNLSESERRYLIQICPPADVTTEILKPIFINQNITNVAVLYHTPFAMDHKIKTMFQTIAIRHEVEWIQVDKKKQIDEIYAKDITTFFVMGNLSAIEGVLNVAAVNGYLTGNFSWYAVSSELNNVRCSECKNATFLWLRPILKDMYKSWNDMLAEKYNLKSERQISISYFFDVALNAVLATRDAKRDNAWNMTYLTCDEVNGTNIPPRTVDFVKYYHKVRPLLK